MSVQNNINIVHSSGSAATLTAAYSGNRLAFPTGGVDQVHLEIDYIPGVDNQHIEILIEDSSDNSNWRKKSVINDGTSSSDAYQVPYKLPLDTMGDPSSSTSTTSTASIDINVAQMYMRVSVRERSGTSAASTFGTCLIVGTLTSYKR